MNDKEKKNTKERSLDNKKRKVYQRIEEHEQEVDQRITSVTASIALKLKEIEQGIKERLGKEFTALYQQLQQQVNSIVAFEREINKLNKSRRMHNKILDNNDLDLRTLHASLKRQNFFLFILALEVFIALCLQSG